MRCICSLPLSAANLYSFAAGVPFCFLKICLLHAQQQKQLLHYAAVLLLEVYRHAASTGTAAAAVDPEAAAAAAAAAAANESPYSLFTFVLYFLLLCPSLTPVQLDITG